MHENADVNFPNRQGFTDPPTTGPDEALVLIVKSGASNRFIEFIGVDDKPQWEPRVISSLT